MTEQATSPRQTALRIWPLIAIGLVTGIFSTLFGVGGGTVMVPLLVLLLAYDTKVSTAPSLAAIFLPATAGVISHAQLEDTLLFPELAKHGLEQGPLPVMRAEHTEIERLLAAALVAPTPALAADLVAGMVELTLEHFHKEEQVLFPMAEQLLGEPLLLELGARWAKEREVHVAR